MSTLTSSLVHNNPNQNQSEHILLKVQSQDGNELFFALKRTTDLKKLMDAYCDGESLDFNSVIFLFDGRRLRREETLNEIPNGAQLGVRALLQLAFHAWCWNNRVESVEMKTLLKEPGPFL